jgi:hypothetical protein
MITAIEELEKYLIITSLDFGRIIISKDLVMKQISNGGEFFKILGTSIYECGNKKRNNLIGPVKIYNSLYPFFAKKGEIIVNKNFDYFDIFYFHGDIVFGEKLTIDKLEIYYEVKNPKYENETFIGSNNSSISVHTIIDELLVDDGFVKYVSVGEKLICVGALFNGIVINHTTKNYKIIWEEKMKTEFPGLKTLSRFVDNNLVINGINFDLNEILSDMGIIEKSPVENNKKQIIACKNFDERNYFVISADGFSSITPQKYSVEEMEKYRTCRTCIVQSIFDKSCIVEKNRDRFELKFSRIQDYIICTDNDACVSGIAILIYDTAYYLVASTKDKLNNLIERIVTAIQ